MPIDTVDDLREHVRLAMQVELTTIPPYLYAMYSIEDQESDAAVLIKSIVAEEMLHLGLCANLLLGLGGDPDFTDPDLPPQYPRLLPHHRPDLMVHLAPAGPEVIRDVFLVIERPEAPGAEPEEDEYETLGQFYYALENAIHRLGAHHDLFAEPQVSRQMGDPAFYAPVAFDAEDSGGLLAIDDIASACEAIEVIVHQGEGLADVRWADPDHQELTHYHKLLQIVDGEAELGAVRPVMTDPKTARFPDDVRPVSDLFNAVYRAFYHTMDRLFSGGDDQGAEVGRLYGTMSRVLGPIARYLTELEGADGFRAGPTFERYDFGAGDPDRHVAALAARVAAEHPRLDPVAQLVG